MNDPNFIPPWATPVSADTSAQDTGADYVPAWAVPVESAKASAGAAMPDQSLVAAAMRDNQLSPIDPTTLRGHANTATGALQSRGYDPKQVATAVSLSKMLEAPMTGGRIAGSGILALGVPAALTLGQVPPFTALPEEAFTVGGVTRLGYGLLRGGVRAAAAGLGDVLGQTIEEAATGQALPTPTEMLNGFLSSAGYQTGGDVVAKGLSTVGGPLVRKNVPGIKGAAKDFYKTVKGYLSPAQQDKRLSIRVGEALTRSSLGGSQRWEQFDSWQRQKAGEMARVLADRMAKDLPKMSDEEFGRTVFGMVNPVGGEKWKAIDAVVSPIYDEVDRLAGTHTVPRMTMQSQPVMLGGKPMLDANRNVVTRTVPVQVGEDLVGARVSTKSLTDFIQQQLTTSENTVEQGRGPLFSGKGAEWARDNILPLKPYIGFAQMRQLRTKVLEMERELGYTRDSSTGIVRRLSGIIDNAMDTAAVDLPDEAKDLYTSLTSFYRNSKELWRSAFDESIIRQLEADPPRAAKLLLDPKNAGRMKDMKASMTQKAATVNGRAVTVPDGRGLAMWNQFRRTLMTGIVDESTDPQTGELVPRMLAKRIHSLSPEVRDVLMTGEEQRGWDNLLTVMSQIRQSQGAQNSLWIRGKQFAQLGQMAAGLGLGVSGFTGEHTDPVKIGIGGAILISPAVLAYAATDRQLQKLLLAGFRAPAAGGATVASTARLIRRYQQLREAEAKAPGRAAARQRWEEAQPSVQDLGGYRGRLAGR